MNRDDIQKLLGGYATGTLTTEEQQALFEAALDDQELFDALAREQTLCDLLREPSAKVQLLAALDREPTRWYQRLLQGWRPVAAVAAMAGVGAIAVLVWQSGRPAKTVLVAQVSAPPAANPLPSAEMSPVPTARPTGAPEEDRRAHARQAETARKPKDIEGPASDSPSALKSAPPALPATPPVPPRALATGFREEPSARDLKGSAGVSTGTVGGLSGGISGGVPGSPPPPPAMAPKQPLPSVQTAPSPAPQQQGQQGAQAQTAAPQPGQLPLAGRSQLDQLRLAQPQAQADKTETVQVQAESASIKALSIPDARSLFWAGTSGVGAFGVAAGRGGAGGGGGSGASAEAARKKVAPLTENSPLRPAVAVNSVASNARAGEIAAGNLGVRYNLMRRTPTGAFEFVDAASVRAGDNLELELMPNDRGTLLVEGRRGNGGWRKLMSQNVEARQTYLTPLRSDDTELQVILARLPLINTAATLQNEKQPAGVTRESTTEPATYVIAGPASQVLRFNIAVNYK